MKNKTFKETFDTAKICLVNDQPATQKEFWLDAFRKLSEKKDLSYQDVVNLMLDINMNVDRDDRLSNEDLY